MKEQTEMDPLKSESVLKKVTQMIAIFKTKPQFTSANLQQIKDAGFQFQIRGLAQ